MSLARSLTVAESLTLILFPLRFFHDSTAVITSSDGAEFKISPELLAIERKTFKQSSKFRACISPRHSVRLSMKSPIVREFTPNVIEPSFGLGRILYTLLEHSFWSREEDVDRGVGFISPACSMTCIPVTTNYGRQVLSLPAVVAPTKVLIVPLSAREEFDPLVQEVCEYIHQPSDRPTFSLNELRIY